MLCCYRNLVALDVDSSDNLTDEALHRFLSRHGSQLHGLVMSGMPHITDQLWQSVLQLLVNAKSVLSENNNYYQRAVLKGNQALPTVIEVNSEN